MSQLKKLCLIVTIFMIVGVPSASAVLIVVQAGYGMTPEAEQKLATVAVPTVRTIAAGEDPMDHARLNCGSLSSAYINILRNANRDDGLGILDSPRAVTFPACFITKPVTSASRLENESLASFAQRVLGASGPKTMARLKALNGNLRDDSGKALSVFKVPFAAPQAVYELRPEAAKDPGATAADLVSLVNNANAVPEQIASLGAKDLVPMAGILVRKSVVCSEPMAIRASDWPFDRAAFQAAMERNKTYRKNHGLPAPDSVTIAVADNGVDGLRVGAFPDSVLRLNGNEIPDNNIDDDNNGFIDDFAGVGIYPGVGPQPAPPNMIDNRNHGTMMASLALGGPEWRTFPAESQPLLRALPINMLQRRVTRTSDSYGYPNSAMHGAVEYAVEQAASIINFSVGTSQVDTAFAAQLADSQLLVIVAAGNDATDYRDDSIYPAAYGAMNALVSARVITVAAIDQTGCLADFSGRGRTAVDIAAPGVSISATDIGGQSLNEDGTSQAAALVSFVASTIRSEGIIGASNIRARLYATVVKRVDLDQYVAAGGFLNAIDAVSVHDDILYLKTSNIADYGALDRPLKLADLCDSVDDATVVQILRIEAGDAVGNLRVLTRKDPRSAMDWRSCIPPAGSSGFYFASPSTARRQVLWSDISSLIPH